MKKRILVLGGSGMLGHKLVQVLSQEEMFDLHCTVRTPPAAHFRAPTANYHTDVNFRYEGAQIYKLLAELKPEIVINAIGVIKQKDLWANVDEVFHLNSSLPHILALQVGKWNGKVIHISTDCVFKGDRGTGYTEKDAPDAEDIYGRSKECGEITYGNHLTLRTSIIGFELGSHLGLLSWLLKSKECADLKGYRKAIFSGLPTCTLSRTILQIIKSHDRLTGLYHIASEPISKLELLTRFSARFGLKCQFSSDESLVIDRTLNDTLLRSQMGAQRPDWKSLIEELWDDYHSLPYENIYGPLSSEIRS